MTANSKRTLHAQLSMIISGCIVVHIASAIAASDVTLGVGLIVGLGAATPVLFVTLFHYRSSTRYWIQVHRAMLLVILLSSIHALLVGPHSRMWWAVIPAVVVLTVLVNAFGARRYKTVERAAERAERNKRDRLAKGKK